LGHTNINIIKKLRIIVKAILALNVTVVKRSKFVWKIIIINLFSLIRKDVKKLEL